MRARTLAIALIALGCGIRPARADQPLAPAPVPAATGTAQDRLVLSGNGEWLTGGAGGWGASALWSHTFESADVLGGGAEYQHVADSHWTNGVLNGVLVLSQGPPTDLYAELHEGSGDLALRSFNYSVITAGALVTPLSWLSVQLEEKRVDVDTTHGNLPKLGLLFRVAPEVLVSASYADSAGGNLGTRLTSVRVDYTGPVTALAGAATGRAAPAVLNLLGQIVAPSPKLTELFAGVGRRFGRAEWQLLADYEDLESFKRTTITLTCTFHLGGPP